MEKFCKSCGQGISEPKLYLWLSEKWPAYGDGCPPQGIVTTEIAAKRHREKGHKVYGINIDKLKEIK